MKRNKSIPKLGEEFWKAADSGTAERVTQLLERGAPVNWTDRHGYSALHRACEFNRHKIVQVILKYKPDVNQKTTKWDDTALHKACYRGYLECVKLLLATKQCDLKIENSSGCTAVEVAFTQHRVSIVKYFLTVYNEAEETLLCVTASRKNSAMVKYLITEQLIDVNEKSPLELSIHKKEYQVIQYICTKVEIDVNMPLANSEYTLLGLAVMDENLDLIDYLIAGNYVSISGPVKVCGLTALGLAILKDKLAVIEHLITEHKVDVNCEVTSSGDTPIDLAVCEDKLEVIKFFIKKLAKGKSGDTALGLLVRQGKIAFIDYLIENDDHLVDFHAPVTISGDLPLGLAIRVGKLDVVKFLFDKKVVDKNYEVTVSLDTPLELAICTGNLDIIKYLVTEQKVEVNGKHLLLACEYDHFSAVNYLLTDLHVDPNAKNDNEQTALSVASPKVIKLLLQNGAAPKDAYSFCDQQLQKVFSREPLKSPVKMFVIGDGGQGKSTLVEAMQHEPTIFSPLVNAFITPKEVAGVDKKTAGIVPRVFQSRFYGDILFYDFAGQEAYYSSHAAFVKSAVESSPPIFVLVIGLHRDEIIIARSVSYWLGIIAEQCGKLKGRAPLLVMGSHSDLIKKKDVIEQKIQHIKSAFQRFRTKFELIKIIPIDCRFSNSEGMKMLRHHIETCSTHIRSKMSVNLNSHSLLIYILDRFAKEIAITVESVRADLLQSNVQEEFHKKKALTSFIPTTIPRLIEICKQLNDNGHILFLFNDESPEKSFIILDKDAILSEINGTMFAPEDFKQHCQLSTSTGVVQQSKLARQFPNYNIHLLTKFLSHLELAVPIEDKEIISLINTYINFQVSTSEQYLFCPALIKLDIPSSALEIQDEDKYHFGWITYCNGEENFFNARFLHVLILRLALSIAYNPLTDPNHPAIQRQCSVWKTGVCWSTSYGFKVFVEVVDKKYVIVLIHSCTLSRKLLEMRSTIIQKVLTAVKEFCELVSDSTEELLLLPGNVKHPFNEATLKKSFRLKSVANSLTISQASHIVDAEGTGNALVSEILPVEVYAGLGENILQALFNESDPMQTQRVSDRFISALSSAWKTNSELVEVVCSTVTTDPFLYHMYKNNVESHLKTWRNNNNGTYSSLRQLLDTLSVFSGKNLLELAGVPFKDFSEDLLPPLKLKEELETSDDNFEDLGGEYDQLKSAEIAKDVFVDLSLNPFINKDYHFERLSLQELTNTTGVSDSQLNAMVFGKNLYILADCFDSVVPYCNTLELTPGQQTDVLTIAERWGTQIAMKKALNLWCQPNPLIATFRKLLEKLLTLKRGDIAVCVCRYIKDYS